MSRILKDAQGFKYVVLELKLNELETMYSERHRAILVVEEDMRKLSGEFYEFPDLIEIVKKESTKQYGIVQKINVETMEELLKAYLSIKKIGWIKDKENLDGLELIKNKEKIKEDKEKEERREKIKKMDEERKTKEKEKKVQKTIFEENKEIKEEQKLNEVCNSDFLDEED